jgi:hypothetical protein
MADDMLVSFYGWDNAKDEQETYLVVKVTGPEEGCTAVVQTATASGQRMFAKLVAGDEWFSQLDIDDPPSKGYFDPAKRKHWRLLAIIFRSVYNHVGVVEGAQPA